MEKSELQYISSCKSIIEEKLGWSESKSWSLRDYEYLSEIIFEETGILLSVSTLRRIWNKNYSRKPHPGTLDALAKFLGYKNWNDFKSNNKTETIEGKQTEPTQESSKFELQRKRGNTFKYAAVVAIPLFIILAGYIINIYKTNNETKYKDVVFNTEIIESAGLPKTLIYNYDISSLGVDSAYIVESWLPSKKIPIPSDKNRFIDVYHFPGFVRTKLFVDDVAIRENVFQIETDGWISLARYHWEDTVPIYIKKGEIFSKGNLFVSEETLHSNKIKTDDGFYVSYYNVKHFGADGDNFELTTKIQGISSSSSHQGSYFYLIIMGENGRTFLPLSQTGYTANISAWFNNVQLNGMDTDLSAFGCDLYKWNEIKLRVENKNFQYTLNGEDKFSFPQEKSFGEIIGLHFIFFGCGQVDFINISDLEGNTIFNDNFGS